FVEDASLTLALPALACARRGAGPSCLCCSPSSCRRTCDAARGADGLREPKALHARVELAPAQTEQLGRLGLVLAGLFERALDERALDRLEVHPVRREVSACRVDGQGDGGGRGQGARGGRGGRGGRALRRLGVPGQMLGVDEAPLTENQRPLHRVAQLADVPAPRAPARPYPAPPDSSRPLRRETASHRPPARAAPPAPTRPR